MKEKLLRYLETFLTQRRSDLINQVLECRTRYITIVLEDIYQPQNASAVLRTCDCLGIQDVHIIENRNRYRVNPDVTLGSDRWLSLVRYRKYDDNSIEAINVLKKSGYRIVATTPYSQSQTPDEFDLHKGKAAIFFGTELKGLSGSVLKNADEFLQIPMFGFTRSFNISVSAAIILYHLTNRLRDSGIKWQLSGDECTALKTKWIKNSLKLGESVNSYPEKGKDEQDETQDR